jgi:hypothetical protein
MRLQIPPNDLDGLNHLLSLANVLRYGKDSNVTQEAMSEALADAQTKLNKLIGNTDNLSISEKMQYLRDSAFDPEEMEKKMKLLNSAWGSNITVSIVTDHGLYDYLSGYRIDDPDFKSMVGDDPQGFIDTLKGLRKYFSASTINDWLAYNSLNPMRDLYRDMGEEFGNLVDEVKRRYPDYELKNVLLRIQEERGKGLSNEEIWTQMDIRHPKSQAMLTRGGIDLTEGKLPLNVKNDPSLAQDDNGGGIQFKIDPAMLQELQNASGFVPVIINIQPMTDLKLFLGINDSQVPAVPAVG